MNGLVRQYIKKRTELIDVTDPGQQSVIELEQIFVLKKQQGKGIGTLLIEQSLKHIKNYLADTNSNLKAILVSTRTDNQAKSLYEKVLKAKEVAVIKGLYSHDEVILLAEIVQT